MANTDGGYVVFGVRGDGSILGVQTCAERSRSIRSETRERVVQAVTDNTDPTIYPTVEYVKLDGRTVIPSTGSGQA